MKQQYRKDITTLKSLYMTFRAAECDCDYEYHRSSYIAFYDLLHALSAKYKTTPRQIAYALTV